MSAIAGTVADGFEGVADEFDRIVRSGRESGAALCMHVDGRRIVDVWAGDCGQGSRWRRDTLVPLLSATKGLVTLCAQILVDRGRLDFDAPVADFWPEFGCTGKQATRVRHVLEHTAGVLTFPRYWEVIDREGTQLADCDPMTSALAAAPPSWAPGTRFQYTPLTFGYLIGELIRRVDGRSIGQFVEEEVSRLLDLDPWIGLPAAESGRVAVVQPEDPAEQPRLRPGNPALTCRRY